MQVLTTRRGPMDVSTPANMADRTPPVPKEATKPLLPEAATITEKYMGLRDDEPPKPQAFGNHIMNTQENSMARNIHKKKGAQQDKHRKPYDT